MGESKQTCRNCGGYNLLCSSCTRNPDISEGNTVIGDWWCKDTSNVVVGNPIIFPDEIKK